MKSENRKKTKKLEIKLKRPSKIEFKKIDGSTDRQKDLETFVNIIYDFACTIFLCDESLIQTHIVPSN